MDKLNEQGMMVKCRDEKRGLRTSLNEMMDLVNTCHNAALISTMSSNSNNINDIYELCWQTQIKNHGHTQQSTAQHDTAQHSRYGR